MAEHSCCDWYWMSFVIHISSCSPIYLLIMNQLFTCSDPDAIEQWDICMNGHRHPLLCLYNLFTVTPFCISCSRQIWAWLDTTQTKPPKTTKQTTAVVCHLVGRKKNQCCAYSLHVLGHLIGRFDQFLEMVECCRDVRRLLQSLKWAERQRGEGSAEGGRGRSWHSELSFQISNFGTVSWNCW